MDADAAAFHNAGLYDPGSARSDQRLALLRYVHGAGASIDRMVEADSAGRLHSLVLDLILESGTMKPAELAAATGTDLTDFVEAYRLLGIAVDPGGGRFFDDEDAVVLSMMAAGMETFTEGGLDEVARAVASALSALAATAVSAFVGSVEHRLEESDDEVGRARATTAAGELAVQLSTHLRPLFRHHLRQAVARQRATTDFQVDRHTSRMAVGFVDLVGFTAATESMQAAELVEFTGDFLGRTYDVVTRLGGQVVKYIGDEVMFNALDAACGCTIGLALIEAFTESGTIPRGGLAHGWLVARHGDLYGPTVNLASRLADVAVPGELLATAEVASRAADPALCFESAGRRQLKGFEDPVPVVSVTSTR